MMRSFSCTAVFLAFSALVFWLSLSYLNSPDADACAARAAYCRQLAIDGKSGEIRIQMEKISSPASRNLAASYLYSFCEKLNDAKNLSDFERETGCKVKMDDAACVRLLRNIKNEVDFSKKNMLRRMGEANALGNAAKKALAYVAISERYSEILGKYEKTCILSKALELFEKYPYPAICEREMLDAGSALVRMEEVRCFMRLLMVMNISSDLLFMVHDGVQSPKILAEYKRRIGDMRLLRKRQYLYTAIKQSWYPLRFDLPSMDADDFAVRLPYAGMGFYTYWKKRKFPDLFRYPEMAYIAFRLGRTDIYEQLAQKSLSNLADDAIMARKTVYCAYAADAFGRLGDIRRMNEVLKSLPQRERPAVIRKVSPYCNAESMELLR